MIRLQSSPANVTSSTTTTNSTPVSAPVSTRPRHRVSRACDICHKRCNKCAPSEVDNVCESCFRGGLECTFKRVAKRRGPAPRPLDTIGPRRQITRPKSIGEGTVPALWKPPEIPVASHEMVEALVACYHDIVFPIFCFFHWPTFIRLVKEKKYLHSQPLYATVMTVCAIAAARVRDGAVNLSMTDGWSLPSVIEESLPEECFRAAEGALPGKLVEYDSFEYVRATALLAITALQDGNFKIMQQYLGNYLTLSALHGRYDERLWGPIAHTEIEERRRLYWSMYTLDTYAAVVWGGIVRCREAQSLIAYPTELDDDYITETSADVSHQPAGTMSWLKGWNFTTDLYRVLEHALDQTRRTNRPHNDISHHLRAINEFPPHRLLELVNDMFAILPPRFKEIRPVSLSFTENIFGFQCANITVTMQTVRMAILASKSGGAEQKCYVCRQLLEAIKPMHPAYLQAISSPLVHHLAGIGHLLGEVLQGPISQEIVCDVRDLLASMAEMLAPIESKLRFAAGGSERIRMHVASIDAFLATQKASSRVSAPRTRRSWTSPAVNAPPHTTILNASSNTSPTHQQPSPPGGRPTHSLMADPSYPAPQTSSRSLDVSRSSDYPMEHPLERPMDRSMEPQSLDRPMEHTLERQPPAPMEQHPLDRNYMDRPLDTGRSMDSGIGHVNGAPLSGGSSDPGGSRNNSMVDHNLSVIPGYQFQLPQDMFAEWPLDFDQGHVFPDFFTYPQTLPPELA